MTVQSSDSFYSGLPGKELIWDGLVTIAACDLHSRNPNVLPVNRS